MHIPQRSFHRQMGNHDDAYEAGDTGALSPGGPRPEPDDLASHMARMGLAGNERRRASDVGAALGPRVAAQRLGDSMRLQTSSSALLADDRRHIHSARHGQPADSRGGGGRFMSALKKGARKGVKGLKQALGFSQSRSGPSDNVGWSARHEERVFRMDAPSPGQGTRRQAAGDGAVDARVTRHDSPPPGASAPKRTKRTRRTSNAPAADLKLLDDFKQALLNGGTLPWVAADYAKHLRHFSEWLVAKGRPPLADRVNTPQLDSELMAYKRQLSHAGGSVASAMTAFKKSYRDGTLMPVLVGLGIVPASAPALPAIVAEDRALFDRFAHAAKADPKIAAGTRDVYLKGFRRLSRWVSSQAAHAERGVGLASHLHAPGLIEDTLQGMDVSGLSISTSALVTCLRTFESTGRIAIKSMRDTRGIPSTDKLLIETLKQRLEVAAGLPPPLPGAAGPKPRRSNADLIASTGRSFSAWLLEQRRPGLASCLLDGTISDEIDLFTEGQQAKTAKTYRSKLNALVATIEPGEIVDIACAQIDPAWFVQTLRAYAGGSSREALAEPMLPHEEAELCQLLDEERYNGLTALGTAYLQTLTEDVRQELQMLLDQRGRASTGASERPSGGADMDPLSDVWEGLLNQPLYSPGTSFGTYAPAWSPAPGAHHQAENPGWSDSADTDLPSDVWDMLQHQPLYSPGADYEAYAPAWTPPPAAHHQPEDIGPAVGEGWRHGPQFASDVLISILGHRGLLPSQYMPQSMFYIHGQPYTATLDPGMRQPTDLNPMGLKVRLTPRWQGG